MTLNPRPGLQPRVVSLVLATALALVASTGWTAETSRLVVEYDPPRLSVEAREVSLAQVLARIGAAVGFEVTGDASSTAVDISLRRVSVEDALRQLLRRENHTLIYRTQEASAGATATLERVVLLPTPRETSRTVEPRGRLAWDRGLDAQWPVDLDPPTITVGDMLAAHATSAMPAPQQPENGTAPGSSAAADPAAMLAETTRRAQQNLAGLVQGLAAASRALQESLRRDPN